MLPPFLNGDTKEISVAKLKVPKAREFAALLQRPYLPFARLLRCEVAKTVAYEVLTCQVEVELGQKTVHDIRRFEDVAVVFDPADKLAPEVLALREDFPVTPHQNLRLFGRPRSLCLFEEPYAELKLRWSALALIERIREWLRLTARGELHQEDQPLEPLLSGTEGTIVLPHDFIENSDSWIPSIIAIQQINDSKDKPVFRLHLNPSPEQGRKPRVIATILTTPPVEHGIIHSQPTTLLELHQFCQKADFDLLGELKTRIRNWIVQKVAGDISDARLIIVAVFPKRRQSGAAVDYPEVWVFCSLDSIHRIAVALGIEGERMIGGYAGVVIDVSNEETKDLSAARHCTILPLRPVFCLSPASAAVLNGSEQPISKRVVAVGLGALGSQIINNLIRSGVADWTLVDRDILLPHNCARHALTGHFVGMSKANGLASAANATVEGASPIRSITADILDPGDKKEELFKAFEAADLIFDLSASVSVARHLADFQFTKARRIAAFLNPSGRDLVVLAEDTARKLPLTWLEMEYYRLAANESSMTEHFLTDGGQVRYARSCGDLTTKLSQSLVALHAAIGSHVLRGLLRRDGAAIEVYRSDRDTLEVRRFAFQPDKFKLIKKSGWTVCVAEQVLEKVNRMRAQRLPVETGGVLVGNFDRQRNVVYIVDALCSPKDSAEWPTLYVRGVRGLRAELLRIEKATLSNLEYVGEWHSHPPGCAAQPSQTDERALATLAEEMARIGSPALMLIVAEGNRHEFFLGR